MVGYTTSAAAIFIALAVIAIVIAIIVIVVKFRPVFKYSTEGLQGAGLSEALRHHGWWLELKPGCVWCTRQQEAIGDPTYGTWCKACDREGYPYWGNTKTGEKRVGFQSEEELNRMADGCPAQGSPPLTPGRLPRN